VNGADGECPDAQSAEILQPPRDIMMRMDRKPKLYPPSDDSIREPDFVDDAHAETMRRTASGREGCGGSNEAMYSSTAFSSGGGSRSVTGTASVLGLPIFLLFDVDKSAMSL
jgi:hypothetical protein